MTYGSRHGQHGQIGLALTYALHYVGWQSETIPYLSEVQSPPVAAPLKFRRGLHAGHAPAPPAPPPVRREGALDEGQGGQLPGRGRGRSGRGRRYTGQIRGGFLKIISVGIPTYAGVKTGF